MKIFIYPSFICSVFVFLNSSTEKKYRLPSESVGAINGLQIVISKLWNNQVGERIPNILPAPTDGLQDRNLFF